MSTITDRIYEFIEKEGIRISEFSKKIGVSSGYFSKQKANNANIGSQILEKIVREYPKINPTWLLLGDGKMRIKDNSDKYQEIVEELSVIENVGVKKYIDNQLSEISQYVTHGAPLLDYLIKLQKVTSITRCYSEIERNAGMISHLIRKYDVKSNMIKHIKRFINDDISIQELKDVLQDKLANQDKLYHILVPYEKVLSEINDVALEPDKENDSFFNQ